MTSSKSKETSGGWSLINHVLRTPTASSPLWSGSRIFFLLLSSNLRLGTLVIWYPRTKCYQSAWKEKKEKEKIIHVTTSYQPLTGHWRPNFSRTNNRLDLRSPWEVVNGWKSSRNLYSLSSSTHIHIRFTHDNRRLGFDESDSRTRPKPFMSETNGKTGEDRRLPTVETRTLLIDY